MVLCDGTAGAIVGSDAKPVGPSSVGSKLLRKMGWAGGGLGLHQEGRTRPVTVVVRSKGERGGLGDKAA